MRVLSICEHLTQGDRSPAHWDPFCILYAIKGRPFPQGANINVHGVVHRITHAQADAAFEHAIRWAAERLAPQIRASVYGVITLVPIPGHACTSKDDVQAHRLFRLVNAIADELNATWGAPTAYVSPMLFWGTVQDSASTGGGTRNAAEVLPHYRYGFRESALAHGSTVVLVDDVVTTGARLAAAEHYLRAQGIAVADIAFVVARTVWSKTDPFGVHTEPYPPVV